MRATTGNDRRPALQAAYAQVAEVVEAVDEGDLGRPTACPAFDVAALVDHIVFASRRAAALGRGDSVEGEDTPHVAVADAPAAIRLAAKEAEQAWGDDRMTAEITMPWGMTYAGWSLVDMYTMELTAHAWDLAQALGRTGDLDESLATVSLEVGRPLVPVDYRGTGDDGMPFGRAVDVPAGSAPYALLAAFLGRNPG